MATTKNTIAHELRDIHQALLKLQKNKDGAAHLLPLQERLRAIDSRRQNGKFVAHDGSVPAGQGELTDQLEDCYQIVFDIETGVNALESELASIKKELNRLDKASGVTSDQLLPLQERLHAVESRRVDGKFMDDHGDIPPGQAKLVALLEECHEIKQHVMQRIK